MVAKRFELLHLTIPEDSTVNSVKTVSYTHLDVYKRQVLTCV